MEKIQTAEYVRSAHSAQDFLADGRPSVAFVGRSNVGKSSLLNALLGRKGLAKTSSTPGRTQTVNYFLINRRLWFVDLPGYGFAKASKEKRQGWARMTEQYFEQAPPQTVVLLVDAKVAGTPLDAAAWEYLQAHLGAPLVAATKIDKVPRGRRQQAIKQLREQVGIPAEAPVYPVSAETGEGLGQLWREIWLRMQQTRGGRDDA